MIKLIAILAITFGIAAASDTDTAKEEREVISRTKVEVLRKALICDGRQKFAKSVFDTIGYNSFDPQKVSVYCGCNFDGNSVYFIDAERTGNSFVNTTYNADGSITRARWLISTHKQDNSKLCLQFVRITTDSSNNETYFNKSERCYEVFEETVGYNQIRMADFQWSMSAQSNKIKKLDKELRLDTFRSIDSLVDLEITKRYIIQ